MPEGPVQLVFEIALRPLLYAALVALVFLPLERAAPIRRSRRTDHRTDLLFATLYQPRSRHNLFSLNRGEE